MKTIWELLPAYVGGTTDSVVYNAGEGLNDSRHIENPNECSFFRDGEAMTEAAFLERVTSVFRAHKPAHHFRGPNNTVRVALFENNRIIVPSLVDGKVKLTFLDEYTGEEHNVCTAGVVHNTSAKAFKEYLALLASCGFTKLYENEMEENLFAELQKDGVLVECSYYPAEHRARFIADVVSVPVTEFGYMAGNGKNEIYSFSLFHGPMDSGFTCDCGMCYLMKLADNSLLMVDGGELEQITEASTTALWKLMHDITGTPAGGTIRLNWFCTHAHDDHADMFSHMLRTHHDEIALERVFFNYPCPDYCYIAPQLYIMISRVRKYYPNVKYRKIHTGDEFTLGNATFTVLQTHDAGLGSVEDGHFHGMNDTSTMLKISFDGVSFTFLGDLDDSAESLILSHYSAATLKTDGVQGAHHLFNFLNKIYEILDPDFCIVPQNEICRVNNNSKKYQQIVKAVPEENILFDDMGSYGWREENGKLVQFYHEKPIGTVYDGTEL